ADNTVNWLVCVAGPRARLLRGSPRRSWFVQTADCPSSRVSISYLATVEIFVRIGLLGGYVDLSLSRPDWSAASKPLCGNTAGNRRPPTAPVRPCPLPDNPGTDGEPAWPRLRPVRRLDAPYLDSFRRHSNLRSGSHMDGTRGLPHDELIG